MIRMRAIPSRLGRLRLSSEPLSLAALEEASRCPRCGAEMASVGSGVGCLGPILFVVPPILVLECPECGYSERSWA